MMRFSGAVLAALISTPAWARAQTIPKDFVYDVKYGVLDILTVWASPFHGSLHKYEIGALSLGVVALASIEDDNGVGPDRHDGHSCGCRQYRLC